MTELDVPEILRTALMYISMGKIPEVVELFQDVHYKDPENQEILYCFGTMMVVLQDYDSAARILKKLLALNPGYVNAHIALAHIYFNTNKVEEAIATLENSVQYDQDHIYLLENMNMMYSYAGMNEKAQEVLDHILSLGKDVREVHCDIAENLYVLKRFKEALARLKIVIDENIDDKSDRRAKTIKRNVLSEM